ncbi:MAG: carbon-nitrogen hydrolase family protein [Desulfitobacteriaceae bacterium]
MRICGIQMSTESNKNDTVTKMIKLSRKAIINQGANFICFPELILTKYFALEYKQENFDIAEPLDGPSVSQFRYEAKKNKVGFGLPLFEKAPGGKFYNSYIIINSSGSIAGVYRKQYLPNTSWSKEPSYFTAGDLVPCVFPVDDMSVAVQLCYDRHFPESTRLMALQGAEILIVPISSIARPGRSNSYQAELISRAIENNMYVMGLNRVGREGDAEFFGGSLLVNPLGQIVESIDHSSDGMIIADISSDFVRETRKQFRHLENLRSDVYRSILKILQ